MHLSLTLLGVHSALAAASPPAPREEPLFEIRGTSTEAVGRLVAAAGDHDGDGMPDFLLTREASPGRVSVEVRSGRTGAVLRELDVSFARALDGRSYGFPGGRSGIFAALGSTGDVDGDAVPEVLVGGLLVSGATGEVLVRPSDDLLLCLTARALDPGDLDADGRDDVVIGTAGIVAFCFPGGALSLPLSPGWIGAYSGLGGGKLHGSAGPLLGGVIGKVGDLDGDGLDDVASARSFSTPCYSVSAGGILEARSSATGNVLWQAYAGASSIAGLSDLDGDRVPELATLAAGGVQEVAYRSGASGDVLVSTPLARSGAVAWRGGLESFDDLDGDGALDLAVGAPESTFPALEWELLQPGPGYVVLLSGRDGQELLRLDGEIRGEGFGASLASVGDLDGDGLSELAVGSPEHVGKDARGQIASLGRVRVFSLRRFLASRGSAGAHGQRPMQAAGWASLGAQRVIPPEHP